MDFEKYAEMLKLNVGEIVKLKKSKKNGKMIAYSSSGKVILFENSKELHEGYVQITKVHEKERVYIARGQNVPFDYYYGISNDEFEEVLKELGFVEEYTREFNYDTGDGEYPNKFKVYANIDRKMLLTVETWNTKDEESYNSINLTFAVNTLGTIWHVLERYGFSHGGGNTSTFDLVRSTLDFPLHKIMDLQLGVNGWNGNHPSLWCYADGHPDEYPSCNQFFIDAAKRIYEFHDDIDKLFDIRTAEAIERYKENMTK